MQGRDCLDRHTLDRASDGLRAEARCVDDIRGRQPHRLVAPCVDRQPLALDLP